MKSSNQEMSVRCQVEGRIVGPEDRLNAVKGIERLGEVERQLT